MNDRADMQKVMKYDAERIVDEVIQERVDKAIYQLIGKRVKEATESLYDYVDNVVADIKTPNSPRGEVRYFGGSSVQRPMNSSDITFQAAGTGAILRSSQDKERDIISLTDYGGVGDDSTDNVAAFTKALAAASGKSLFIPDGTFRINSEAIYNVATSGLIEIFGTGPGSIIKPVGASNKGLHITGTAGVTISPVTIRSLRFLDGTSSGSAALLHLDGIAHWLLQDVWVNGNSKATIGIQLTAAEQGQVSGGELISCTTGALLEASGLVRSNGVEWHGMTFNNTTTNLKVSTNGADDFFFHSNHLTSASMQLDLDGGGTGQLSITDNHLEPLTGNNGIIVRSGKVLISGNSCYGSSGTKDIEIVSGTAIIVGNVTDANVTLDASSTNSVFAFNMTGGTITDNGSNTRNFANYAFSGTPLTFTHLGDSLTATVLYAAATAALDGSTASIQSNDAIYARQGLFAHGNSGNPTTGSGLELLGGSTPFVRAYNRTSGAALPLGINDQGGSIIFGVAGQISTTATDGFIYIVTCAGAPTGVPTTQTGRVPMIYDSTNNNFYIYNSGWKKVALA